GCHAMAVSTLVGRGDPEITSLLPATVDPARMALTALHAWEEDAYAHVARWGLPVFRPDELRDSSQTLVPWLQGTGASKVAVHLDVDTVDSAEPALGRGKVPAALTRAQQPR